jgi:hypothetical protein
MKTRTILPFPKPASHPMRFLQPFRQAVRLFLPLAMVCTLFFADVKSARAQFYYFAGNPAVATSWWTNPDGTGTNPALLFNGSVYLISFGRLATFTSAPMLTGGSIIRVQNASTLSLAGAGAGLDGGSVVVENGATVQIIDNPGGMLTAAFTYEPGPPGSTLQYLGSTPRTAGAEFPTTIHNLIVNKPGASLTADAGNINGFSTVQAGILDLNAVGTLNINGPHTVAAGAISSIGGPGVFNLNGATNIAAGGTVSWNASNTTTLNAPIVSSGIGVITVTGVGTLSATALAPITVNAGSMALSNDALNIQLGGLVTVTGGALSLAGSTPQYSLNAGATVSGEHQRTT